MRSLWQQHRRLVIWAGAGAVVLVVFLLRARAQAGSSSLTASSTDPNATGTATDPNAAYDSGYSAGLTAADGGGLGGVPIGSVPVPSPPPAPKPKPVGGLPYVIIGGRKVYGVGVHGNLFYSEAAWRQALKRRAAAAAHKKVSPKPPLKGTTASGHKPGKQQPRVAA